MIEELKKKDYILKNTVQIEVSPKKDKEADFPKPEEAPIPLIRLKCVQGCCLGNEFIVTEKCNIIGKLANPSIITIKDEFMSGKHCQLTKNEKNIYIKDIGSTNGTFLLLRSETEIFLNSIIKMGSSEFKVNTLTKDKAHIKASEGDALGKEFIILKGKKFTIGRNADCSLSVKTDEEMSDCHGTIILKDNDKLYVTDEKSSNG